jgi:putative FmdB family regulatory protein
MPTYEYACAKCKKDFELFQSMKDDALKICPKDKCRMKTWGKGPVKRKLGVGAGFIFKGSGFYITDYRSEGYKKSKSEGAPKADAPKADTPKSDSKPAAKPAAKTD